MSQNNVIIILVCHNMDIVNSILSDPKKNRYHILFVGDKPISNELQSNPLVTVVRNLPNNIEKEKDLLTFTAWYAIVKNNLFSEYEYVCILEYDVHLENNFESELIQKCRMKTYDIVSFIFVPFAFTCDIKENVMNFFLNKKGLSFKNLGTWFATTNHCLKRNLLIEFVDWYYPDCLEIKKLDPAKISWYHERIFNSFMDSRAYNICHLNLLSHGFSNSHGYMHNNSIDITSPLLDHYMNNPNCEFLKKLIDHYDFFLKLNVEFRVNVGSYLCPGHSYTYSYDIYEKQKLLFQSAKTCNNALLIGNYMGHIAFIMLLANPNINITCIDIQENQKYIPLLETHFQTNIPFIVVKDQEEIAKQLPMIRHNFDFIHMSQQYPSREYLNTYVDLCICETKLKNVTFMIDDYNVYWNELIEKIKTNNLHCEVTNEIIVNGSNTTKKWDMAIKNKKYLLIYDDDSNQFTNHIDILINSVRKYDKSFEIIFFHKKDIDPDFVRTNKYILDQHRGGGYWLWKPYIICETLKKIGENDLLFYIDSKYYFTESFGELYKDLLRQDLLVWRNKPNEPSYSLKNWCKMDIIQKYHIFDQVFHHNMEACWAGSMIMRKTSQVTAMMQEWLQMCCCNDITDSPSTVPNSREFYDHRHDQSLLSIVLWKHNVPLHSFPKKYVQNVRQPY